MSQFSGHDPNGQAISAAGGVARYDRRGWRRWLVPAAVGIAAVAALAVVWALLRG